MIILRHPCISSYVNIEYTLHVENMSCKPSYRNTVSGTGCPQTLQLYTFLALAAQSNDHGRASIQMRHINDTVCPCLPNVPVEPEGSEMSC